jgi:predicted nucleic acid-binding protein
MTETVFVDTNILVYLRDPSDPDRQRVAAEWFARLWDEVSGRISWQVLQEFYVVMTRKLDPPADPARVRQDIDALATWAPVPTEQGIVESAWRIEDRYGFSWWDSLVVAQALASGATTLLTEDLQHGQEIEGLRIVNPFEVAPGEVAPGG